MQVTGRSCATISSKNPDPHTKCYTLLLFIIRRCQEVLLPGRIHSRRSGDKSAHHSPTPLLASSLNPGICSGKLARVRHDSDVQPARAFQQACKNDLQSYKVAKVCNARLTTSWTPICQHSDRMFGIFRVKTGIFTLFGT